VQVIDETSFKLLDTGTGQVKVISQGGALGQQSFSDAQTATTASITLASIDSNSHLINLIGHGLTNGQKVYYASMEADGTGTVGGLQNEKAYTVRVLSPNAIQLLDATTGQTVAITDPGAASRQQLGYVGTTFSFNPSSAVDASQGLITLPANGLHTGDAVIYRVDPTKSHTVIVPSQTAGGAAGTPLSITATDTPIGGLNNNEIYFVVRVDADHIRLVHSVSDALAAMPIDLTAAGSGANQSVASNPLSGGINVVASLEASNTGSAAPTTGGDAPQFKDVASGASVSPMMLFNGASALKAMASGPTDQNGKNINDGVKNDGLSGAGGVVINIADHTVDAFVGNQATAAAPTVLSTPANVTVSSTITQATQINAQSSVTKPDDSQGSAVSLSIGVGVYSNAANATIYSNAKVDAGALLTVLSDVEYPMLADPAVLYSPAGIAQQFKDNGISGISSYLDGTLGVSSNLLNTWVVTAANAGDSQATAISGSIAVNVFTNTSHATIQSGAQINQDVAIQSGVQGVTVSATTKMTLLDVAGMGQFNLNPGGLFDAGKAIKSGEKGLGDVISGGDLIDLGGRSGSKSLGGSILVTALTNDTMAIIGAGAAVHIGVGAGAGLTMVAEENIFRVQIAQSGGTQSGAGGTVAFAGSGLGYRQRSNNYAGIDAGATVTGGGPVSITAHTGGTQIGIAGSLVRSQGGTTGIGMSVAVDDIQRNTVAFIGASPSSPDTTPAAATTLTVGNVALSAKTDGLILGIAIAGTVNTQPKPGETEGDVNATPPASDDDPLDGMSLPNLFAEEGATPGPSGGAAQSTKSGIGVAGGAVVNVVTDTTLAYINTTGTASVGTLKVDAANASDLFTASGGVAVARQGPTRSPSPRRARARSTASTPRSPPTIRPTARLSPARSRSTGWSTRPPR
jgi:hypothetical protein